MLRLTSRPETNEGHLDPAHAEGGRRLAKALAELGDERRRLIEILSQLAD